MKCPADLEPRWARQWENPDLRETRLLDEAAWPQRLSIGRPSPTEISENWREVALCIKLWRELRTGTVHWVTIPFRATGTPVEIPVFWEISTPGEWVAAANDRTVDDEYKTLHRILAATNPIFHPTLVRERSLWRSRITSEVIKACSLVMQLSPGCAAGNPLRSLPLAGIDSKFFERHRPLIVRLLDLRHDGEISRQGLETFLDAWREHDHWLLVADLGKEPSLPFPLLRVRSSDLAVQGITGANALLVVENESCVHLLPRNLPGTVAILGPGNNLAWLGSFPFKETRVGYWGDLDTWGLTLLSRARSQAPHLTPLLMTREIFDLHGSVAVPEGAPASTSSPVNLTAAEADFYQHLLTCESGRLEQEFLPASLVQVAVRTWATQSGVGQAGAESLRP